MIGSAEACAAVTRYFAAINSLDADTWVATFAPDGVSHDPVAGELHRGPAALRAFFNGIAGAFASVSMTQDHVFVSGRSVAVKWTGQGIWKDGRSVRFEGIDVFEVTAHGAIQSISGYWDPATLLAPLKAER